MAGYSLILILVLVSLCKGLESDYPCSKTRCYNGQTCYPVAVNCQEKCSYKSQCLGHGTPQSPCPFGNPLMRSNGTPYLCDFGSNNSCPSKSSCYPSDTDQVAICCWKYSVGKSSEPEACPKPSRNGNCKTDCLEDSDCHGREKCCFNGCGRQCLDFKRELAGVPYVQQPGRCPTEKPPAFVCSYRAKCYTDDECVNGYKCCHISGCGSVCRPPVITRSKSTIFNSNKGISIQNPSNNGNCPWFKKIYGGC